MLNKQNDYHELLSLWNGYKKMTGKPQIFHILINYCFYKLLFIILFSDVRNYKMTTMVSETALFKDRANALIGISNVLEDFDLTASLQILKDRVCSIGNLNSGGKFEWINSILIKVS